MGIPAGSPEEISAREAIARHTVASSGSSSSSSLSATLLDRNAAGGLDNAQNLVADPAPPSAAMVEDPVPTSLSFRSGSRSTAAAHPTNMLAHAHPSSETQHAMAAALSGFVVDGPASASSTTTTSSSSAPSSSSPSSSAAASVRPASQWLLYFQRRQARPTCS